MFPQLTGLHEADGPGLGQLEGRDPALALHLRAGLEVEGLRAAVGDDEAARVLGVNEGVGQVDGAATRVGHLRLIPVWG